MQSDDRNVIDYYKYWTVDAIRADLDTKRNNFSVLISNEFNDFNIGAIIRNSNAFLAKEVIILGKKSYDRRGTVGTHNYENMKYVRFIEELSLPENSLIVGVDNIDNAEVIDNFIYPSDRHVVLAFGQEQIGLSDSIKAICHNFVYIRQFGSVRSLNVGVASGIAMFDYMRKMSDKAKTH
jgi:tRNA G18 (ribose-2'-O)-methylase SpoU